jgi:hypothetical protein
MNNESFDALESAQDFMILGLTNQPQNEHGYTFEPTEHASNSTNQGLSMRYTENELMGYDSDDESIESIDVFDLALPNGAPEQSSDETPLILEGYGSKSTPSILQVRCQDEVFNASTSSLQERYTRSNFQEPSRQQKPIMDDSPLQAFLRGSKGGQDTLPADTQHTKTTLVSSLADDDSITSIDAFDSDDFEDALRLTEDTILDFQESQGSFNPAGSMSSLSGGPFDGDKSGDSEPFHDSLSSLNSAFEQLSACMERTARSRRMVTHFSKRALGNTALGKKKDNSHDRRGLTRLGGSQRSLNSSSGSVSSSGQLNKRKSHTNAPVKARKTSSKPKKSLLKQLDHMTLISGPAGLVKLPNPQAA